METEHYFYVLYCKDDTFYGGYTTDPERRLKEHNSGTGAKYTRLPSRLPAKMIHTEVFSNRSEATKAEYAFKKLTRKQKITYLQEQGVKEWD
ncbi:GIY-YIG nuclease family protein [Enterococcus caccae]|uniref:GIY-YIG nuclease superfamily protein n=1 Tax=Enterococcus caccae ATCC BAA-1240 TaxID=1158612 RepID=R3W7E6_9ENTE|nr:GIY-YIG nuclease family protein [Enterococcus caccae]EOL43716.1 GIY-YIG nuclease superfamily protein [Enterococcus caccae ATCC BAA-1240]EOT67884.1 GIY-YIG nuclease superfamily protein [Enterococcus caccae ATCC BAA-1240]